MKLKAYKFVYYCSYSGLFILFLSLIDHCASQKTKKSSVTNNTRKKPPLPQPYSGSLFGRINSMEIADDFLTVESNPIKSSSFSEERSLEASQVTGRPKATSLDNSPPTLKTLAAIVSDRSRNDQKKINQEHFQTPPLSIKNHNTIDGHEDTVKHDISSRCDSATVSCSEPKVVTTEEMEKQKSGSKDEDKESDVYVVMAATNSVKESISTPLLSEDNMYVTMSPLLPRQHSLRVEDHTYYNFHEPSNASLPNFKTIELLEEDEEYGDTRSSFGITKVFLSQDNYDDNGSLYEPVDYSRPIPPPRRKKLLKLQQCSPLSSPGSSPILRYHTMSQSKSTTLSPPPSSSTKNPSNYSPFLILRKHRTVSTPDGRKEERRKRPEGMVFSDAVADGLLLRDTTAPQESR